MPFRAVQRALRYAALLMLCRPAAAGEIDFDKQVAPLLAGRCLECHRGNEAKGKLDLSRHKSAMEGGESGAAIVAGKPADSLLWQRIEADEMPPKHPLPPDERAILKQWLASGAKWGADPIDPFRYTTAARAGVDWWSLQKLSRPHVPTVKNSAWAKNAIDHFVLAKLDAAGLTPSPTASDAALQRRVAFDLVGLPTTAFPGDQPGYYPALVDALLRSHHYGERWARHWLDVAHFGESDGFEFDRMRPHAWRYRDWVIDALNRDLPYDEFARLQIAGDILRPTDPEAVVATGFLVGGSHDSLLPRGEVMQMIMRQDELEDLVAVVGQTFLGLTVNCARCHDHKFDPIRQEDYYRLAASLAGVKRGNRDIPLPPPADLLAQHEKAAAELEPLVAAAQAAALAARKAGQATQQPVPQPIARWNFDKDLRDSVGTLHGLAQGAAVLENGALVLDGKSAFVSTRALSQDLTEKTLEAWVQLDSLTQRGGGLFGVETADGKTFDTIVFGEREPKRWIAGSNNFRRTISLMNAADEAAAAERFVHLAVVYQADGQIQMYREGQPYGDAYQSTMPIRFEAGNSGLLFGLRHSPAAKGKFLAAKIDRARLYDRALSADEIAASAGTVSSHVSEAELLATLAGDARERYVHLKAEVARLAAELQTYRDRQTYAVTPQKAPVVQLLNRGNVQEPGKEIAPSGMEALACSEPDFHLPPNATDAERRTRLAEWVASDRNPLFARTIVNRVWQHHFGRGLVETPNDLGFSGGPASHPELLDWLACELIERRWSLKDLHRLIVASATYQQASRPRDECLAIDADNRLLWRYSPRRLEAEAVRDGMLALAGQLNPAPGGPSYMDFQPFVHKNTQYYEPLDPVGAEFNRRSVYRFWARGGRNPLLDTFDCPDPSTIVPRRGSTTTPLQALSLMNNSFTLRMADHFAERLARERPAAAKAQVQRAFELAYGEAVSEPELRAAQQFVATHGLAAFCRVLLNTNGFLYVN